MNAPFVCDGPSGNLSFPHPQTTGAHEFDIYPPCFCFPHVNKDGRHLRDASGAGTNTKVHRQQGPIGDKIRIKNMMTMTTGWATHFPQRTYKVSEEGGHHQSNLDTPFHNNYKSNSVSNSVACSWNQKVLCEIVMTGFVQCWSGSWRLRHRSTMQLDYSRANLSTTVSALHPVTDICIYAS